jgi:hypothetical protein
MPSTASCWQASSLFYGSRGVADFLDDCAKLIPTDTKLMGPTLCFSRTVEVYLASIRRFFSGQRIHLDLWQAHLCSTNQR